jgi:5-methylcytosine-specific restriction endonuclease McrA
MIITEELIDSFRTKYGGYTQLTTRALGGICSSRRGWKRKCIGKEISLEVIKLIEDDIQRRNERVDERKERHQECVMRNPKHGIKKLSKKERKLQKKLKRQLGQNQTPVQKKTIKYNNDVNSKEFLQSYEWRTVRMVVLKRDGAICACCGASPKTGAVMNVDHIKPRRTHPQLALDPANLQVLCDACNHGKGNWDDTDWRDRPDNVIILRKKT